jgi:regulatory protein
VSPAERRAERALIVDPSGVLDAGLRFLEARPRSAAETRRRLLSAGYRPDLVEGAVDRLLELGLLDDATFARTWVASRDRAHPRGERALRAELVRKGIERDVIETVLAERSAQGAGPGREGASGGSLPVARGEGSAADEDAARRLLTRRRASLERVADPRARRQRAYALLARNGFDPETAARVAARFVEDAEP